MLQTQTITKDAKALLDFKQVYFSSFPKSEQTPIWFLLQRAKRANISFCAYYDGDIFAGFSYIIVQDDLTYIQYLAVNANIRSKGYGSQILNHIKERYPNNRMILAIETEDETAANNEERIKRKKFYVKNGYASAGFSMKTNGNVFEALVYNGTCSFEEFQALFKKYMGFPLYLFYNPKVIR